MSAVFLKLLNMSIAAGWLVVAVIVLRLCLKKAPKAIHCALWALVAFRLLCPFSLESSFSLIPEEVANGKGREDYAVFETKELNRFQFDVFSPAPPVVTLLTDKELAQFNETFYPIVYDKQGNPISVNPVSGFFSSYYDDVRNMDFEEFMRYFPGDGSFANDAEFEALKTVEAWPFDWVETRDDMPVPIHKYQARIVDMVLKENAGITTADLDTSDVAYLANYDAFYNYTSDFGPGMFTCTRGEVIGDTIRLYEELETGTDMLTLRKVGDNYQIVAHQCIEGDNAAEAVYG